jgi:hypothetical protein
MACDSSSDQESTSVPVIPTSAAVSKESVASA